MGRLLIFLSGAQSDILTDVRVDRPKYSGVGFAILFTGVLACVSMSFALYTALSAPLSVAVPAGVVWGFLIMGIDRMLVSSMPRGHGRRNFGLVILPRLLLGLLLSIVISTPIVLEIFRPDIEQQIGVIHQAQLATAAQAEQNDQLGRQIANLKTNINSLTQQIEQTDTKTALLQQQYQGEESAVAAANARLQCQLSGGPGCVAGNGPLAKTAAGDGQADQDKAAATQRNIQDLDNTKAYFEQQLTIAQGQLNPLLAEQKAANAKATPNTLADGGLLIRLEALDQLASRSTTVQVARILLFLLFVVIECMPVVSKVLLNIGDQNAYEMALEYDTGIQLQVAQKMSEDKLRDADSILEQKEQIRAAAESAPTRPLRSRRLAWPFAWGLPGATPRGPRRPRPGRRPPRIPRARRGLGRFAFWRWGWRREADDWSPWVPSPDGTGGWSADGSRLPLIFLREPVPGTPPGDTPGDGTP